MLWSCHRLKSRWNWGVWRNAKCWFQDLVAWRRCSVGINLWRETLSVMAEKKMHIKKWKATDSRSQRQWNHDIFSHFLHNIRGKWDVFEWTWTPFLMRLDLTHWINIYFCCFVTGVSVFCCNALYLCEERGWVMRGLSFVFGQFFLLYAAALFYTKALGKWWNDLTRFTTKVIKSDKCLQPQ